MKKLLAWLTAFFLISQSAHSQHITLVKNGTPQSVILLPQKPGVIEVQAAKVIQEYLERISGASLPIESESIVHK